MILICIFVIIYVVSLLAVGAVYIDSGISITFWALCAFLLPGVNTVVLVILLFKEYGVKQINEFFSFKKFLSDINEI